MKIFSLFKKKIKTGFTYNQLETWIDSIMQTTISDDVVAFCFNLYEDANKAWSLELVGAGSFDINDTDWVCDEVFTSRNNLFTWYDDGEWQDVQRAVIKMLKEYLRKGRYGTALKERQGLAVGFVDGDLTLL